MSRKDFELIAEVIYGLGFNLTPEVVALAFAYRLKETNPLFDRSKFLKACGVKND